MKIILFSDELEYSKIDSIRAFLDTLNNLTPEIDEEVRIYLDCVGGDMSLSFLIIDVINSLPYKEQIIMIPLLRIESGGFNIFFHTKTKKRFIYHTIGMLHKGSLEVNVFEKAKENNIRSLQEHIHNTIMNDYIKEWLPHLEKKEWELFDSGEDVYLNVARMKEIARSKGLEVVE